MHRHTECRRASSRKLSFRFFPIALAGFMFLAALAVPSAFAHPPKDVALSYDAPSKALSVKVAHSSFFPSRHYVKNVVISLNGKTVRSEPYTSQPAGDAFTYTYTVEASPGDELSVTALCNVFGSKETKLTVPK